MFHLGNEGQRSYSISCLATGLDIMFHIDYLFFNLDLKVKKLKLAPQHLASTYNHSSTLPAPFSSRFHVKVHLTKPFVNIFLFSKAKNPQTVVTIFCLLISTPQLS